MVTAQAPELLHKRALHHLDMPKDDRGEIILYESDDWYVMVVDRAGIKRSLIETNKTQSNMTVSDDEMKQNPEMVKAAILAELRRWVDNGSFRRQPRREAQNLLTSRYVMTWKRQSDGSRVMKCRICVRGFQDMHKDDLSTGTVVHPHAGDNALW